MGSKRIKVLSDAATISTRYKKPAKANKSDRIGLGLESTFKPKKIKRVDVSFDEQTTHTDKTDKSVLYTAGWSMGEDDH